ncbi:MAG: signal peptidase I [Ruminococcaceae bacterium]|nr:signal peptidase I [Oscillospiraceae bacterium]
MDNKNETPVSNTPAHAKSNGNSAKKAVASIFEIFEMFAVCTAVILLLFSYVAKLTIVEGSSMEDTLYENDYLIVQDIGYTPERGDIVVIHKITAKLGRPNAEPIIKRVIAVEGDTVDIDFDTWTVYVNGEAIDEPYTNLEDTPSSFGTQFPLTVEENKIFVLGDHRNHSADSRVSEIGQVDVRCVVGRAVLRVLPFEKFGIMERAKYD